MTNKKILITGASIAGPTIAYWLHKYGFDVTVLERSPAIRLGGQNIDVKGPAKEIVCKMGLEDNVRAANTTEIGMRFVSPENHILAEFPKESSLSMTQELEILRGDLVKILYEHTKDKVTYRFGDYITSLDQQADHISVTLASGLNEKYDLIIAAEGIGSSTRKLAFGSDPRFKFLKLYTAYLTIPKTTSDSRWARWCNVKKGVVFMLRPDNYGETRASITFLSEEQKYRELPLAQQKEILINRIKDTGWESDRLIAAIARTQDLYFDKVSQVKADKWSTGRFALVGDAAYCATPIAGKGTDLSMAGAYILAGELFRADNHQDAFAAYEQRMRPYVDKCQRLPPGVPGLVYPTTSFGVRLLNSAVYLVGSRPVKWLASLFSSKKKDVQPEIELPDYERQ
ncbi:FAD-dependent monooxygenase [Chitinophaga rhizophila]|uniref:FAD-dependent monooxygenase n=1 Tax=Chitinophaga rhizophila TaxID=2866212 RepID=A0ABS7GAS9_9BACT|nr:FAD-dependent monooxygenase [Chitinophaga rhizophila]MBW8684775.1 FAD-dependent monooxygenase [Chitinophaga rhizophila]